VWAVLGAVLRSAGLLLAAPLAVCLVVARKHVDGLGSLTMLLEESPTKAD